LLRIIIKVVPKPVKFLQYSLSRPEAGWEWAGLLGTRRWELGVPWKDSQHIPFANRSNRATRKNPATSIANP